MCPVGSTYLIGLLCTTAYRFKLCGLPGLGTRDVPITAAPCTHLPIAGSSADRQSDASVSWPIRCALAFGQRHHVALVVQALRTSQPRLLVLPRVAPLSGHSVAAVRAMRVVLLLGHHSAARIHDYTGGSTVATRGVLKPPPLAQTPRSAEGSPVAGRCRHRSRGSAEAFLCPLRRRRLPR